MHTKERLLPMAGMPTNILTEGGLRVARCDFDGVFNAEAETNAKRFMDCWNALAGIADPAAEMKRYREIVAKVREIVNYQQSDIHDRIDELAKLLPPETP